MWIEILETFALPPTGLYLKGMKYDLPDNTLKQIKAKGKHLWRKTKAPWTDASICPNYGVAARPAVDSGEEQEVQD